LSDEAQIIGRHLLQPAVQRERERERSFIDKREREREREKGTESDE
jgi:hypothetical protein